MTQLWSTAIEVINRVGTTVYITVYIISVKVWPKVKIINPT